MLPVAAVNLNYWTSISSHCRRTQTASNLIFIKKNEIFSTHWSKKRYCQKQNLKTNRNFIYLRKFCGFVQLKSFAQFLVDCQQVVTHLVSGFLENYKILVYNFCSMILRLLKFCYGACDPLTCGYKKASSCAEAKP